MGNSFTKPVEHIVEEGRVYLDEQMENVKLRTVKGLSQGTTAITVILLIFSIVSVLLLMLAFAVVLWLGELLDSYALAASIVAGVLLLGLVVVLLLRDKLFRNSFVEMYSDILNPRQRETTLEGLDTAIGASGASIRMQGEQLKDSLSQVKQFYTPSHLLNEGLRQAGLRSSMGGFRLGRFLTASLRALTGKKK